MNRHVNPPVSASSKEYNLAPEMFSDLKMVYRKLENNSSGDDWYEYEGVYNPEYDYGEKRIIVPLTSVFAGTETWHQGDEFANVVGSTGDIGYEFKDGNWESHTWEEFCTRAGINTSWECHAEHNHFYDCGSGQLITAADYTCNDVWNPVTRKYTNVIGGHVVKGRYPQRVDKDAPTPVYILPICKHHNSKVGIRRYSGLVGPGTGFYMVVKDASVNVLKLERYHVDPR